MYDHYPFRLPPLPYAYQALSPQLDACSLRIHHDTLLSAYIAKLNRLLAPYPEYHQWTLWELVQHWMQLPPSIRTEVRNQAGGVYNHRLFFEGMAPSHTTTPSPTFLSHLGNSFGSWRDLHTSVKNIGQQFFGSGYLWLLAFPDGEMQLTTTPNQNVPHAGTPILNLDLWEHSYYPQYESRRSEYLENWLPLINWDMVEQRYEQAQQ